MNTALLLLPNKFSSLDLFETIASLSYSGDPRFAYGMESRDKVKNIVMANPDAFMELYNGVIENSDFMRCISGTGQDKIYEQAGDRAAASSISRKLPNELQKRYSVIVLLYTRYALLYVRLLDIQA